MMAFFILLKLIRVILSKILNYRNKFIYYFGLLLKKTNVIKYSF